MGSSTLQKKNDLHKKHEGRVGHTLSNKNQVKSFSFSGVVCDLQGHPTIYMSLSYKSEPTGHHNGGFGVVPQMSAKTSDSPESSSGPDTFLRLVESLTCTM
jgi:hypothetical protein